MRFYVRRTSDFMGDSKPCEEAIPAKAPVWDLRTFRTEQEADAKFGRGWWYGEGTEHGRYKGGICRRMADEDAWAVELADLDELERFIDKHGEVVVGRREERWERNGPLQIEIYDGYRE